MMSSFDTPPVSTPTDTELSQSDPYRRFVGSVPEMVDTAVAAAVKDGFSYRDFLVGASVLAYQDGTHVSRIFSRGNLKQHRHREKVCAERKSLRAANKIGMTKAIGIVVAGTDDREQIAAVSDRPSRTLHPCGQCRDEFRNDTLIADDTIIMTVGMTRDNRPSGIYEVQTADELWKFYDSQVVTSRGISGNLDLNAAVWRHKQSEYDDLTANVSYLNRPDICAQAAKLVLIAATTSPV